VLAGGRSTRFGSDKLEALDRGIPLLDHAVLRLAEVCDEVVVVVGATAPDPGLPNGVTAPVRLTRDVREAEGPLAGLLAGLIDVPDADLALVAGGDMPELLPDVLRAMIRVADRDAAEAVLLRERATDRPLPLVVRVAPARDAARALLASGERRLTALPAALRTSAIAEEDWIVLDPQRKTLRDVDVPGDLEPPSAPG
jgi:molybdopterin-guanine dinucleotide biosynthesis protein A